MVLKKATSLHCNQTRCFRFFITRKKISKNAIPDEKSEYATHNPGYALSDLTNETLISDNMKCVNDAVCVECFDLLKTIETVHEKNSNNC